MTRQKNKISTNEPHPPLPRRSQSQSIIKKILLDIGLIVLAAVLFAASFPNVLIKNGAAFFAWFAYIPILIVIQRNNILACIFWGIVYGIASYSLFNYWLGNFHPVAGIVVYSTYAIYLALVFMLIKLAGIFFEKRAYLIQWIIWLAYEYLRTTGFLGYAYGITGYSQWQFIPLIQIASITGVWGVSALVTFPSFWLAGIFSKNFNEKFLPRTTQTNTNEEIRENKILNNRFVMFVWFVVKKNTIPVIVWLVILIASLIFGFININYYSSKAASGDFRTADIALIQHNTDPWDASKAPAHWLRIEEYRKDLSILKKLSDEALAQLKQRVSNPKTQLVVWPETAFIPRIYWHTTYREDQQSWAIVKELLDYLSDKEIPFLIGNDDGRLDAGRNRIDYNAALLFENGINTAAYRKLHLVPFTEHFPYKKNFPKINQWLENSDTHFWEKGNEETIFSLNDFKFSALICFEDTFGYLARKFSLKGSEIFINLTNDAWSKSLSSQKQHLSMAVFRSAENFRPTVRSTVSGQTCVIDPTGKVILEAASFSEEFLIACVPLINQNKITLYTRYGDFLGVFFCAAASLLLIFGAVWYTIRKHKSFKKAEDTP